MENLNSLFRIIVLTVIMLLLPSFLYSQSYILIRSVFGSGGTRIASNNYILNGTISQTVIGISQFSNIINYTGFWYQFDTTNDTTNVDYNVVLPNKTLLLQNYPNPLNSTTTFEFYLSNYEYVELSVYNLFGKKIVEIFKGNLVAGIHKISFDKIDLTNGVYLYRLIHKNGILSKKMIILN